MSFMFRNLFQKIKNYNLHFLFLCFFVILQSQSSEEHFAAGRSFTAENSNYQPETLEESLHYIELYEFLSKNHNAFLLLESARKGGVYYSAAQEEFIRYVMNPLPDLKAGFDLINNNTSLKARAKIGGQLQGADVSLLAELDLKELSKDIFDRLIDKDHNEQIADTAKYYTRETYTCIESPYQCPMNALSHQRLAVRMVDQHFHNFPKAVDSNGNLLSFEQKAEDSSPAQLETANALFNAGRLRKISSQVEGISAANEQNAQDITLSREELIKTVNKHAQNFQEESLREIEKRRQAGRKNLRETDPDYMNEDPVVLSADNNIKKWKTEKEDLLKDFEQGKISQAKYDQEIENIDRTISAKETDIEVYKFKRGMQNKMAWAGAVSAGAKVLGAPEEIVQLSQAVQAGMQTFDAVGSMIIAGAVDPTGITLALNGVSAIFQIVSGVPSTDQIIVDSLNQLRKGQVQIVNKLKEMDMKIEGVDAKVESIIDLLNMSYTQITQKLDHVADELHRIENEIILAIEESRNAADKEFQNIAAHFTDDSRVTLDLFETWGRLHLNEILSQCKQYKDQYDQTNHIRFYHDYNWCMDEARNQLSMIQERLSDLFQKAKHRFGSDTYVHFGEIKDFSITKVVSEWNKKVEDRIGLLPSIVSWLGGQSRYINNNSIKNLWSNEEEQWKEYEQFSNSLKSLSVKHPGFYDEVVSVYAPLTEQLPRPEYLSFVRGSPSSDYEDKQLMEICQNLKYIEDLSFYNRKHLEKAWWVYLHLSDQMRKSLDRFFENNLLQLLENYKSYDPSDSSSAKEDCNCSSVYTQTKDAFFKYMSSRRQTDIFEYIADKKYSIHEFLKLDPEETVQQAMNRKHITDQYLVNEGFSQTVQGNCLRVQKSGEDSSSKKVPYVEAELEIEEQQQHFTAVQGRLQREKKCVIIDREGVMEGLNKGSLFRVEQYAPLKNVIGKTEYKLGHACLLFARRLDGQGTGAVIGGIVGGAAGFLVDIFTGGATGGAGTAGGAAAGAMLGAKIDGEEFAFSLCEIAELRPGVDKSYSNEITAVGGSLSRLYYKKKPLTSYLKSTLETIPVPPKLDVTESIISTPRIEAQQMDAVKTMQIEVWPYHFVCKKKACLKFGTKRVQDREEWVQTAAIQIRQTQMYLNEQLKSWFKTAEVSKDDTEGVSKLSGSFFSQIEAEGNNTESSSKFHLLLPKSALALDTMARAGYGQNLKDQPELSKIIDVELENLKQDTSELRPEQILELIQNLRSLPEEGQEIPALPVQPIRKDIPPGLGNTEDRYQALNIILNRSYLSPKECRDLKKERRQ